MRFYGKHPTTEETLFAVPDRTLPGLVDTKTQQVHVGDKNMHHGEIYDAAYPKDTNFAGWSPAVHVLFSGPSADFRAGISILFRWTGEEWALKEADVRQVARALLAAGVPGDTPVNVIDFGLNDVPLKDVSAAVSVAQEVKAARAWLAKAAIFDSKVPEDMDEIHPRELFARNQAGIVDATTQEVHAGDEFDTHDEIYNRVRRAGVAIPRAVKVYFVGPKDGGPAIEIYSTFGTGVRRDPSENAFGDDPGVGEHLVTASEVRQAARALLAAGIPPETPVWVMAQGIDKVPLREVSSRVGVGKAAEARLARAWLSKEVHFQTSKPGGMGDLFDYGAPGVIDNQKQKVHVGFYTDNHGTVLHEAQRQGLIERGRLSHGVRVVFDWSDRRQKNIVHIYDQYEYGTENAGRITAGDVRATARTLLASGIPGDTIVDVPAFSLYEVPLSDLQARVSVAQEVKEARAWLGKAILPLEQRAWQGQGTGAGRMTRQQREALGAAGEGLAARALAETRGGTYSNLNEPGKRPAALDLFGGNLGVEVKTGVATRAKGSWNVTLGSFTAKERAAIAGFTPEERREYWVKKKQLALQRKNDLLQKLSAKVGHAVEGATIGVIMSQDGTSGDVYLIPGLHATLGWKTHAVESNYLGTFGTGGRE
jgi:hypothetical protein